MYPKDQQIRDRLLAMPEGAAITIDGIMWQRTGESGWQCAVVGYGGGQSRIPIIIGDVERAVLLTLALGKIDRVPLLIGVHGVAKRLSEREVKNGG